MLYKASLQPVTCIVLENLCPPGSPSGYHLGVSCGPPAWPVQVCDPYRYARYFPVIRVIHTVTTFEQSWDYLAHDFRGFFLLFSQQMRSLWWVRRSAGDDLSLSAKCSEKWFQNVSWELHCLSLRTITQRMISYRYLIPHAHTLTAWHNWRLILPHSSFFIFSLSGINCFYWCLELNINNWWCGIRHQICKITDLPRHCHLPSHHLGVSLVSLHFSVISIIMTCSGASLSVSTHTHAHTHIHTL